MGKLSLRILYTIILLDRHVRRKLAFTDFLGWGLLASENKSRCARVRATFLGNVAKIFPRYIRVFKLFPYL